MAPHPKGQRNNPRKDHKGQHRGNDGYTHSGVPVKQVVPAPTQKPPPEPKSTVFGPLAALTGISTMLPVVGCLTGLLTFLTCLILGQVSGRAYGGMELAYLSDLVEPSTEYIIAIVGVSIVAILVWIPVILLAFYSIVWIVQQYQMTRGLLMVNTVSVVMGILSGLAVTLAVILDTGNYTDVHRAMSIVFTVTLFLWILSDITLTVLISLSFETVLPSLASRRRKKTLLSILLLLIGLWLYPISYPLLCDGRVFYNCTGMHTGRAVGQYLGVILLLVYLATFAGHFADVIAMGRLPQEEEEPTIPPMLRTGELTPRPRRKRRHRYEGFYYDNDGDTPRVFRYSDGVSEDESVERMVRSPLSRAMRVRRQQERRENEEDVAVVGRKGMSETRALEQASRSRQPRAKQATVDSGSDDSVKARKRFLFFGSRGSGSSDNDSSSPFDSYGSSYDSDYEIYSDHLTDVSLRGHEARPMPGQVSVVKVPEREPAVIQLQRAPTLSQTTASSPLTKASAYPGYASQGGGGGGGGGGPFRQPTATPTFPLPPPRDITRGDGGAGPPGGAGSAPRPVSNTGPRLGSGGSRLGARGGGATSAGYGRGGGATSFGYASENRL